MRKTQHTPLELAFRRPWPGTIRGLILWYFGWAFIIIGGINYIGTPVPEPTRTYLSAALRYAPGWVYGILFVLVGVFSIVVSYCHYDRDRWGYTLSAVLAGAWATVYACGFLFYEAPARSLGSAVVWGLYALILTTCARIPKIAFHFARRS